MTILLLNYHLSSQNQQLNGFEEYLTHFWDRIVPDQRRRMLPSLTLEELPHADMNMTRYDAYHLAQLQKIGRARPLVKSRVDNSVSVYRKVILLVPAASVALLIATVILAVNP